MVDTLRKVWAILEPRERRQLMWLTPAVVIMGILQTVGMASILPFLALLADPTSEAKSGMMQWLYQLGNFDTQEGFLLFVGGLSLVTLTVANAFSALTTWRVYRFSWMRNHTLSKRLLSSYLKRPYTFFLQHNSADLSKSVLAEVGAVVSHYIVNGMQFFARLTLMALTIILLVIVDPILAIVAALTIGALYGGIYALVRRRLAHIGKQRLDANADRFKATTEIFGGIKESKVLGLESALLARFDAPSMRQADRLATAAVIAHIPKFALETVAFGSVLVMVMYLLRVEGTVAGALPLLGLYGFAAIRMLPAMQTIFVATTNMRFHIATLESVHHDIMATAETEGDTADIEALPFEERIALEGVSLAYPGAEEMVLEEIDLEIPRGHWVAFVGVTGSGKSTLADVVLGLLSPQQGKIQVDGTEIGPHNMRGWQKNIGYVPQHLFMMDDSVLRNISFNVDDATIDREAVEHAARIAQIHDFIVNELPQGYDTPLGEQGIRLSGGQRQRIGIARALYRNPSLLILDEATSALDTPTEARFFEELGRQREGRTIISIAHRMSTTRDCDCIFVLADGKLVERGTYDELLADGPVFGLLLGAAA